MGKGGGGGSSGRVDYPEYIKDIHRYILDGTDDDIGTGGIVGEVDSVENPYTGAYAFDPSGSFDDVWDALRVYKQEVEEFSSNQVFRQFVSDANDAISDTIMSDDDIDTLVDAYEDDQTISHARNVARFSAAMADIGSINTSSFTVGNALLEDEFDKIVAKFRGELTAGNYKLRTQFLLAGIDALFKTTAFKVDNLSKLITATGETSRIEFVAQNEFLSKDLEINAKEAHFDLSKYAFVGNLLGSVSGTAVSTAADKGNPLGSALGGAMSGAAAGTAVGGPIGAAVGGVLGAASAFL